MKSFLLFILVLLSVATTKAQIGIGTTSPSAQLDITATNATTPSNTDGILIPRVAAFPATNPTSSQNGMMIFLTAISGVKLPGFYYWNDATSAWLGVGSTLTNNWGILGNTGTSSSINFIGTTDDVDIVLKRKGVKAGFIGNPSYDFTTFRYTITPAGNGNTSFGSNSLLNPTIDLTPISPQPQLGVGNTATGANSLTSNTTGYYNTTVGSNSLTANTTGYRNVAIGSNTLPANTTGAMNVSVGDITMFSNTIGSENVAVGVAALYSNINGYYNVAIGRNTLTSTGVNNTANTASSNTAIGYYAMNNNTNGNYNTAVGRQALTNNTIGNYNVSLGYRAGYSIAALGSNNVFLGTYAGYNETGSNKLYIDNTTFTAAGTNNATTSLIYGDFASSPKILRTNSQFQIGDPGVSPATGYALPTTRGTSGQFLQTDGSGATSWASTTGVFPYSTTGSSTGVYNVALTQYTVRVFGSVSEVRLPTPIGNTGKVFVIIGSNGISSKTFSSAAGNIYDDVSAAFITTISGSVRYTVQSDGTDWIVIGN